MAREGNGTIFVSLLRFVISLMQLTALLLIISARLFPEGTQEVLGGLIIGQQHDRN